MGCLFGLVAVVQTVFHYLGWLGMFLGVVAILFANTPRGLELLVGGISFIVLKYIVGVVFNVIVRVVGPK
jgi:hypothetical protein